MKLNIVNFIKNTVNNFSKNNSVDDLEISLEGIRDIIDTYISLEEINKVAPLSSKKNTDIIKEFYKEFHKSEPNVKLSATNNFPLDIQTLFKNVKVNGDFIRDEIDNISGDIVVTQAMTAAKANYFRAVSHYYFLTEYALDLANYFYINEVDNASIKLSKKAMLNKQQIKFIEANMWIFARLLSVYGDDSDSFLDRINNLKDVYIPKEDIEEIEELYEPNNLDILNNLPVGFIGSPIYSVRLIFAEWEATRYKELKNKKKLLELRYLYLKMLKENGDSDIGLEKEIESLQKQLTDIDYSISKIEKSAGM